MSERMNKSLLLAALLLLTACASTAAAPPATPLEELRRRGISGKDVDTTAEWLTAELVQPGGSPTRAADARRRLLALNHQTSMLAQVALGLDAKLHGRLREAPDHFLGAVRSARTSESPRAPYVAWLAAHEASALRHHAPGLWKRWKPVVLAAIRRPGALAWRARNSLVHWWIAEEWALANPRVEHLAARELGCALEVRLAGPFGLGPAAEILRHHPPERPAPWPATWAPEPGAWSSPRLLETETTSCTVRAKEYVDRGVFYAETFATLAQPREVLLSVSGATRVWVDDHLVLDRDPRRWGSVHDAGVQMKLSAGEHRILASLSAPETSIQLLDASGVPLGAQTHASPVGLYALEAPRISGQPNVISRLLSEGERAQGSDAILRLFAAMLANMEQQGDVANVIFEPFVRNVEAATGPALLLSAQFTRNDPVFGADQVRDLVRELHTRAVEKDDRLYEARLALASWEAEQAGRSRVVPTLDRLAAEFDEIPSIGLARASNYEQLGWRAEYQSAVLTLERGFPEAPEVLGAAVEVHDALGHPQRAEQLVERLLRLDPDNEIRFRRAVVRGHYDVALAELERLKKRRPQSKSLEQRIQAVELAAARRQESFEQLRESVEQTPRDPQARLALADAQLASGSPDALLHALVDAVANGAPSEPLEKALDLEEGMSELEPYRLSSEEVIRAYEQRNEHMPGTAARVLDYAALWIRADGSSRMLEHEIVRIQSAEGIRRFAEQDAVDGLVLSMRVIKKDGRILQPEIVAGKPTLTYPHLEVGDYIETEHVISLSGPDGDTAYVGPRWFFREEDVAYSRSEFLVISPEHVDLQIETQGNVPAPLVERPPGVTVHRWRVDQSPSASAEPFGAPLLEVLPSVRVGWGVTLERRLRRISGQVVSLVPLDPRIERITRRVLDGVPRGESRRAAETLYRWVLENVQPGDENDGRRVLVSKQGNRWQGFELLCRAAGIPVQYALARSTLSAPPTGPISRAEQFSTPLLQVLRGADATWLTLGTGEQADKYLPFGYLPPWLRGAHARTLAVSGSGETRVPPGAGKDETLYDGELTLDASGDAQGTLRFTFSGATAIQLRGALEYLPTTRWRSALESGLVGNKIAGATIQKHEVRHLEDVSRPLVLIVSVTIPRFAQKTGRGLRFAAPFMPPLSKLASTNERQTPLLIGAPIRERLELKIRLPAGYTARVPKASLIELDGRSVRIRDRIQEGSLILSRRVTIPAERIPPPEYPRFAKFAREGSLALSASIQLAAAR